MEDKYYTPSIEEFHVGFECEIFNANNEWFPIVFSKGQLYNDLKFVDKFDDNLNNAFRVKYLDREDIESLRWNVKESKLSPYTGKDILTYTLIIEQGFNTGVVYTLEELLSNDYLITSQEYSSYGNQKYEMLFKIKNKSELKKLMKQLKMINE